MSAMPSNGFVGVSTPDRPGCVGRTAARTASRSPSGTAVCSRPQRSEHLARTAGTSRRTRRPGCTTWSPGGSTSQQGVLGGKPGGEGEAACAALERGAGTLQRGRGSGWRCGCTRNRRAGRRPRPACRSTSVDRHDDGAGQRVGLLTGVDGPGVEAGHPLTVAARGCWRLTAVRRQDELSPLIRRDGRAGPAG